MIFILLVGKENENARINIVIVMILRKQKYTLLTTGLMETRVARFVGLQKNLTQTGIKQKVLRDMPNEAKELKAVKKHLEDAAVYNMESEIVWSAVKIAKENPKEDFHVIFKEARDEWDI